MQDFIKVIREEGFKAAYLKQFSDEPDLPAAQLNAMFDFFGRLAQASRQSGLDEFEQFIVETSAEGFTQALRKGIEIAGLADRTEADLSRFPLWTILPQQTFDDLRYRIDNGKDLDRVDGAVAARALEKIATGWAPNEVEISVLEGIFDHDFATAIRDAVAESFLVKLPPTNSPLTRKDLEVTPDYPQVSRVSSRESERPRPSGPTLEPAPVYETERPVMDDRQRGQHRSNWRDRDDRRGNGNWR